MLAYTIEADRNAIVEGLALFNAGETKTFTEQDAEAFFNFRGLKLNQGNLPEGLTLTVTVKED
jgi:hypothetical protein